LPPAGRALIRGIRLKTDDERPISGVKEAAGGQVRVFDPWSPDASALTAKVFEYCVPA
jgi:hypothetical protein